MLRSASGYRLRLLLESLRLFVHMSVSAWKASIFDQYPFAADPVMPDGDRDRFQRNSGGLIHPKYIRDTVRVVLRLEQRRGEGSNESSGYEYHRNRSKRLY
jgi:hypothetical protein